MSHYSNSPMGIFEGYGELDEPEEQADTHFNWYNAGATFSGNSLEAGQECDRLIQLHSPKNVRWASCEFQAGFYKE